MIRWFLDSSLKFSRLVIALAIALVAIGVASLQGASVDVYPEFRQPTVEVQAEALGLSAAEVEQLITVPLEQDLLNGVPWVERVTSRSIPGLSSVQLTFEEGTDLYRARQVVQERMTQAHALPGVGTPPVVIQPKASVNRITMIGLASTSVTPIEMSVLARWQIKPRLLGVAGVANVSVWGQRDRQLQVQVDPSRLHANKVTLTRLIETTGNALWVSPLSFVEASTPGTGGFVETPNQRIGVQHVSPITSARELADVVLEGGSAPARIGDVADVVEDHQVLIGDAAIDARPTIMIVVDKFPEANTAQVARDVAKAMADLQPGLRGITVDTQVYRPASFIENALNSLGLTVLIGLLLMVAVIALGMRSWQAAVISLVAVPTSAVAALYVLHLRGATFTSMTVLGLAVALTLIVDDLVTDVDLLRRRLAQNAAPLEPLPRGSVIVDALHEARRPSTYATMIALVAAAPLVLLTGVVGAFTRQVAITFALALLACLLVAVTLTPALALLLPGPRADRVPPLHRWVTRAFDRVVAGSIPSKGRALAVTGVLVLAGLAVIPQLGSGVTLPVLQDRTLLVGLETAPGTSLTEMTRVTGAVSQELRTAPGVTKVGSHVGRALTSDQVVDVNAAELWLTIAPDADKAATSSAVRRIVTGYPGVRAEVSGYADDRISAASPSPKADLVVRVYGDDMATLQQTAQGVRDMIGTVRGVVSPSVEAMPAQPTVRVEVDLDRAKQYGLKPGDVRREAATLISGLLVGNLYDQQKVFDVVVWGTPAVRQSPSTVASLLIDTPDGRQVRLGDLATVSIAPEPVVLAHDAVRRYLDVLASVPDRDLSAVTAEVTTRLRGMSMPLEYRAEVVTQQTPTQQVTGPLLAWLVAAAVGIVLLFQAATRSWRLAALLALAIPLAGGGTVLAAPAVGGITSAGALAGLVAILALAGRQSLVLLDRAGVITRLPGGQEWSAASITAARERATPIVVSHLAIAALFLPAAVTRSAGLEFLHPVAVTVLAGLVTSAIVSLYLVPALSAAFLDGAPGVDAEEADGVSPARGDVAQPAPLPAQPSPDGGSSQATATTTQMGS